MTASHLHNINNSKEVIPLLKYSIFLSQTKLEHYQEDSCKFCKSRGKLIGNFHTLYHARGHSSCEIKFQN